MSTKAVTCLAFLLWSLAPFCALAQPAETSPAAAEPLIEPVLSSDVEFARNIALIRADLRMADDLVKERDWVDARLHVNFPREEIYGVIREQLRTYKTPPFDGALRELARAVVARSIKRYDRAAKKVQGALIAADLALRGRQKDWPRFTLVVAAATLHDAAEEYDEAVANGRISAVGYQSARGIVFESDRMVESLAKDIAGRDAEASRAVHGNLMRLKHVFSSVAAPKEPRVDVESVRKLVAETGALMQAIK